MRLVFAIAFALVSTSALAGPAMPTDDFAANVAGRRLAAREELVCFSRVYDPAHLQRHPNQNVKQAMMLLHINRKWNPDTPYVHFHFGFRTLASAKTQVVPTACELRTDEDGRSHLACIDVGCGYSNTIALVQTADPGRPRLIVTADRLNDDDIPRDNPAGDGKPIALHSDDRAFILEPAPLAECKPLMADARRF
jgi:hypothetical protein